MVCFAAEPGRRHAELPPELIAEIKRVAESELKCDLLDRQAGFRQQVTGGFHPALYPVLVR